MAIVQNPVTGRSKNAFANAIFTTLLGKNVMRSKPLQVANPQTIPQQKARKKITFLSEQGKDLKNVLEIGYKKAATGMYPRNMFTKENYSTVAVDNNLAVTQTVANVKISKGSLGDAPTITAANVDNSFNIQVDYTTDGQSYPATVRAAIAVISSAGVVRGVNTNAGLYTNELAEARIQGAVVGDRVFIFAYDTVTLEVTDTSSQVLA